MRYRERLWGNLCRIAERALPVPALSLVLLPFAVVTATLELAGLKRSEVTLCDILRMPESLLPGGRGWRRIPRIWCTRVALTMTGYTYFWVDRYREPRWSRRCTFNGIKHLNQALEGGRSVLLLYLHVGNLSLLPNWLRARGYKTAVIAVKDIRRVSPFWAQIGHQANLANQLTEVPLVFQVDQLAEALRFLKRPGVILATGIEETRDLANPSIGRKTLLMTRKDYAISLASGGLRLAEMAKAQIVPCPITSSGIMGCKIHIGTPVPELEADSPLRYQFACEHLMQAFDAWSPLWKGQYLLGSFLHAVRPAPIETLRPACAAPGSGPKTGPGCGWAVSTGATRLAK